MLHKIKILLVSLLVLNITACSHIYGEQGLLKNRQYEYMKARSIPPMRVPPGYSSEQIQANYPISTESYSLEAARIDLSPPGLYPGYRTGH